jgi:hypothetical protein
MPIYVNRERKGEWRSARSWDWRSGSNASASSRWATCGWNVDSEETIKSIPNELYPYGTTTGPPGQRCLVEARVTTRTHASWQSIGNGQKNRPPHSEELLGKRRGVFDMRKDLQTQDDIIGLVGCPGRKVGMDKADSRGKTRESFDIEAGPRDRRRKRTEKRRLATSDIQHRRGLESCYKVKGDTIVRPR